MSVDGTGEAGALMIAIDRWGRLLLQRRSPELDPAFYPGHWCVPGGGLRAGEAPDEAALREFEEETGWLLEEARLYRVFRREALVGLACECEHVYFIDADVPEEALESREGAALRYFTPAEAATLAMVPGHRRILEEFVASAAYRAMFH